MTTIILFAVIFCSVPLLVASQCSNGAAYDQSGNRCLQFFPSSIDFKSAETVCEVLSGHLASVHNTISNNLLVQLAQRYFVDDVWLGLNTESVDVENPLNWWWTDGSAFDYQNYQKGQPESRGTTSCMLLQLSSAKWITSSCDVRSSFICQYAVQSTPTPLVPVLTTCPKSVPSHCPTEYAWFEKTDYCYKHYVGYTNFTDARSICESDGGDLASIHSQKENDYLVELSKAGFTNEDLDWNNNVWIGLYYTNNQWQWTDGTKVDYLNWGNGEPNKMDIEWWTSLVADPHQGNNKEESKWNNVAKIEQRAFICKQKSLH